MSQGPASHGDRGRPPRPLAPPPKGEQKMLQAAAIIAVGAAAVSFVAGLGTYLYIRFTQHRGNPPGGGGAPP